MHRVVFKPVALLLAFLTLSLGGLYTSPAKAATADANGFVTGLSKEVLGVIGNKAMDEASKEKKLIEIFTRVIDINWIGKFALGRYARTATPEQLVRYNKVYTQYLINSYVPNFRQYTGEELKITNIIEPKTEEYLVQTQIIRPDGTTIQVDYRLRKNPKAAAFIIYDIIGEGVSLIATQRSEFNSVIAQQGIDALLAQLEKRVSTAK
jgi:phospholipid transport system substrate-binding protein